MYVIGNTLSFNNPPHPETQGHLTVGCAQGNREFESCLGGVRQR